MNLLVPSKVCNSIKKVLHELQPVAMSTVNGGCSFREKSIHIFSLVDSSIGVMPFMICSLSKPYLKDEMVCPE